MSMNIDIEVVYNLSKDLHVCGAAMLKRYKIRYFGTKHSKFENIGSRCMH